MSDKRTTVDELKQLVEQFVAERDWHQFHTPKNLAMALAIEAAELMEHFQWLEPAQSRAVAGDKTRRDAVGEELADVVHWDHVIGHHALPGAPVWLSAALDAAISAGDPRAARYLADAAEFDSKWYVPRPGPHAWPTDRRPLADGDVLAAGPLALTALHLPGHSPDLGSFAYI